jgi:hypothetical protein
MVPVFLPLVVTTDATVTAILTIVIIIFTAVFPIALLLSKGEEE